MVEIGYRPPFRTIKCLLMKGQLQEALAYCEESFDAARARGDAVGMATALANLASIRNSMGDHDDALDLARRAETKLGDEHAPDILLGALGRQAEAFEGLGRLAEAEERYEARRDLAQSELSYYAKALRGLAGIKRELAESRDEAHELYKEAARVFCNLQDYGGYGAAQNDLGVLELKAGSLGTAEEAFRQALASAVEDEHEGDQARARMNFGVTYQSRGTPEGYEAAEAEYREAFPSVLNWGEPDLLGDVLLNLAQLLYFYVGRYQDARAEAVAAAEAYGRAGSVKESWARNLIKDIDGYIG